MDLQKKKTYNHDKYLQHREEQLKYQKAYYLKSKQKLSNSA